MKLRQIIAGVALTGLATLVSCSSNEKDQEAPSAQYQAVEVALGDMDGDGDLDIVKAEGGKLWYMRNLGSGSFGEPIYLADINQPSYKGVGISIGDVDKDGDLDIIVAIPGEDIRYVKNTGQFSPSI